MAAENDTREAQEDASSQITEILTLLGKMTERFDSGETQEWHWLDQHSSAPEVVEVLRDSTVLTLRVIGAIGQFEPINGITISERFRIPKGTVSKITRRLLTKRLIASETLPNNKKEILFRLTPLGRAANDLHRTFDGQMERGFMRFLARYDASELAIVARILRDATEASFLDLGLQQSTDEGAAE